MRRSRLLEGAMATWVLTDQSAMNGWRRNVRGEQCLLMLDAGPKNTLRPVSPEGRYRYDKATDTLTGVVSNKVTKELTTKRLHSVEPSLRS